MKLILENIKLSPDQAESDLAHAILLEYGLQTTSFTILKRSLDARNKNNIHYTYRISVSVTESEGKVLLQNSEVSLWEEKAIQNSKSIKKSENVIIIGSGPAGLFCALRLIDAGCTVTILERGKDVDERMKDIGILEREGELNTESNVLFGEGGAGTYSDGKLTSRTNRNEISWFYKRLLDFGAHESVSYMTRPHIGSDKLREIIKRVRLFIQERGSQIIFNERVDDLITDKGKIAGIRCSSGNEYISKRVVCATGHSARDIYSLLKKRDILLEKKGFAMGVRIEHPAELIYDIQYGKQNRKYDLPAADYRLAWNNKKTGRGVYSFCMCPGGSVINSSSEPGMLTTNGMSYSGRNGQYSNAALVVTVNPDDSGNDTLEGIELQRRVEIACFNAGTKNYRAPAMRATTLLDGKIDNTLPDSSYLPSIVPADISSYLPQWIVSELKLALQEFNKKMKGFLSDQALLVGAETRTSSPVRIVRNNSFQSPSCAGLYPAGEGAGYSGGIVSSAVDGIRVADAIIEELV